MLLLLSAESLQMKARKVIDWYIANQQGYMPDTCLPDSIGIQMSFVISWLVIYYLRSCAGKIHLVCLANKVAYSRQIDKSAFREYSLNCDNYLQKGLYWWRVDSSIWWWLVSSQVVCGTVYQTDYDCYHSCHHTDRSRIFLSMTWSFLQRIK